MLLVDTDLLVDVLRRYPPVLAWLDTLGDEELSVPGFVAMELIQGCSNKMEQKRVERMLAKYSIRWPGQDTYRVAFQVFAKHHLSHRLGILDTVIGHLAVSIGVPLCTFNRKHYSVIPNLTLIEPYKREPQRKGS